MQTDENSYREG